MTPAALEGGIVERRELVAVEQTLLTVRAPAVVRGAYVRPGQYCELRAPGCDAAPYALYTAPSEGELGFLLRGGSDAVDRVLALAPGAAIEIGRPSGEGFDVDALAGEKVVLVATGTGIAPIRAVVVEASARGLPLSSFTLFYGVRDQTWNAVARDAEHWRQAGMHVELLTSRSGETRRQVQHAVSAAGPTLRNTIILAVGHPEMVADVRQLALTAGATAVLTNH